MISGAGAGHVPVAGARHMTERLLLTMVWYLWNAAQIAN